MVNNVFSTYELAKEMAEKKAKELEQDIFICHSKYLSGEEFVLKTRDELGHGSYLYMIKLPFEHHFAIKRHAEREANRIADIENVPVWVDKKIEDEAGYSMIKYYFLTYKEPCST